MPRRRSILEAASPALLLSLAVLAAILTGCGSTAVPTLSKGDGTKLLQAVTHVRRAAAAGQFEAAQSRLRELRARILALRGQGRLDPADASPILRADGRALKAARRELVAARSLETSTAETQEESTSVTSTPRPAPKPGPQPKPEPAPKPAPPAKPAPPPKPEPSKPAPK